MLSEGGSRRVNESIDRRSILNMDLPQIISGETGRSRGGTMRRGRAAGRSGNGSVKIYD